MSDRIARVFGGEALILPAGVVQQMRIILWILPPARSGFASLADFIGDIRIFFYAAQDQIG